MALSRLFLSSDRRLSVESSVRPFQKREPLRLRDEALLFLGWCRRGPGRFGPLLVRYEHRQWRRPARI